MEELSLAKVVREDLEELTGYIEKPFTKDDLVNTVDEIIKEFKNIHRRVDRIRKKVEDGESMAKSYEETARKMMLHERFLEKLREMEVEKREEPNQVQIEDLLESEEIAMKMLQLRKKVIEMMAGIE